MFGVLTMKIIGKSNFDDGLVADILVKDNLSEEEAKRITDKMNGKSSYYSTYYYVVVPDDYSLYQFEP